MQTTFKMQWLRILEFVLGFASALISYIDRKQILEAGEAKAIVESLKNANKAIQKARMARNNAVNDFDKRGGVPDENDPNLRD